ncbi:MAG: hypothetical protein INH41_22005 [Myxococcaceae bacterium]|jgi:hypothetical protein|nr:hypothetical protein [Myxococcaceae bacterium]MCA3015069.1 hypothetical protein [Myxococcaceae bacterium]
METFTVDKRSPTSFLLIDGTISGWGAYSGDMQQGWRFGSAPEVLAQSVMYDASNLSKIYPTKAVLFSSVTGPQPLVFRYFTANGQNGDRPFITYNPNSSDNARLGQTQSVYVVYEIEP